MTLVPDSIRHTYLATVITVEGQRVVQAVMDLGPFWVLTANNPGSEPLDDAENAKRHQMLSNQLRLDGHRSYPAVGTSPDGSWSEESVAVPGLDQAAALAYGRRFGQHAVFEVTADELWVHGCAEDWQVSRALDA